jgi:hypothetical protein
MTRLRPRAFVKGSQPRVRATDHRLHRRYFGAEPHLGGGREVRRVATRPRAATIIAAVKLDPYADIIGDDYLTFGRRDRADRKGRKFVL